MHRQILDLARGGNPNSLISCCIFEAANSAPLSSISLLSFTILAFADRCEFLHSVCLKQQQHENYFRGS